MLALHPDRVLKNVDGPFYGTGDCLACGLPEAKAADLLAPLDDDNQDTYFVRQPETPDQVEAACEAIKVCCVSALRYGGTDVNMIRRLGNDPEYCDYLIGEDGTVTRRARDSGLLKRFAAWFFTP